MIFPKKRGGVDVNLLCMVIFMFRGPVRVTMETMILVEMFQSLSLYCRGYDHFKKSNLLLQIWTLELFYQKRVENVTEAFSHNRIRNHTIILSMWDSPKNEEGWRIFLTHLTGNDIQWQLPWVHGRTLCWANRLILLSLLGWKSSIPTDLQESSNRLGLSKAFICGQVWHW